MGVGVYESTFHDRGGTFLVDGPLGTDEDYESYRLDCESDGVDALSREGWAQQDYDDENGFLLDSATTAAKKAGLSAAARKQFSSAYAPFDREFSLLAEDDFVAVGWRSWQHDFVIGVGPTTRAEQMLDFDAAESAVELGRSIDGFKADYDALAAAVLEYVRLEAMRNGLGCRYRTSGYTTAAYPAVENPLARLAELRAAVAALRERLSAGREEALTLISYEERLVVIEAAIDAGQDVVFAVADKKDPGIHLYSAADPDSDGCELLASMMVPAELEEWFATLPPDAFVAVPREPRTEAWFKARQMSPREPNLIASAEEIAAATGNEVSIEIYSSEDDPDLTTQVLMASPSVSAPTAGLR